MRLKLPLIHLYVWQAALDYMSVVNDFGSNVDGSAKAEQDREAEMQSLLNDLAGKRNMLALLDHYLAVLNGTACLYICVPSRVVEDLIFLLPLLLCISFSLSSF